MLADHQQRLFARFGAVVRVPGEPPVHRPGDSLVLPPVVVEAHQAPDLEQRRPAQVLDDVADLVDTVHEHEVEGFPGGKRFVLLS